LRQILHHVEALTSSIPERARREPFEKIRALVARSFGVTIADMLSERRKRDVVVARQLCFVLGRCLTPLSFPKIGKLMGFRDHSTVQHGANKMEWLRNILEREMEHDVGNEESGHNTEYWVRFACQLVKERDAQSKQSKVKYGKAPVDAALYR